MSTPGQDLRPGFTAHMVAGGVRQFTARGDQPLASQLLLDAVRALPGTLGLVIVDLCEPPREWIGGNLTRVQVLEGLLALRDLLGQGAMDVAVFSSGEGVEIFLDRSGVLEIRTGGSWEPRARSLLESRGFRWVSTFPDSPAENVRPATPLTRERIAAVSEFLDLRATSASYASRARP